MAHLLPFYLYASKSFYIEPSYICTATRLDRGSWKSASYRSKINEQKRPVARNSKGCVVQCCSTSTSSSSAAGKRVYIEDRRSNEEKEEEYEYLVSEFGWKVRRLAKNEREMREVAHIQAEAFHTPMALFDDLFFEFFKVKLVLSSADSPEMINIKGYACLVAEPAADSSKSQTKLVGIVDVTALRDEAVLQHLRGAQEYLYISGIAVLKCFRRQKIGSVLLKACDMLSILWGFEYLALRAYEDDLGARKLYKNAGYKVVSSDPQWVTWIGRRPRVLMIKRSNWLN